MTLLHEAETLAALTEIDGPAGDWARTRLVLIEPNRAVPLPAEFESYTSVLVSASDALDRILPTLESSPALGAIAVLEALEMGLCPVDPTTLIATVSGAIREDGSTADLMFATSLARLGAADGRALQAAARSTAPDRDWLLPSIALAAAGAMGSLAAIVDEVAAELLRAEQNRPGAIELCLAELGVPFRGYWDVPQQSVDDVASMLGVNTIELGPKKGSRKRLAQQAVRHLLAGRADPASALVTALANADSELATYLVYSAAWIALFEPSDPVLDAIYRHGALDVVRLAEARRATTPEHEPFLRKALEEGFTRASILAQALPDQPLADAVIDALIASDIGHRVDLFLGVRAAWSVPHRVPALLASDETVGFGLALAKWMPTVEVLQALLDVRPPEGPDWTAMYADALASMGDPATLDLLRALIQEDPEATAHARQLAESILHQPLS